MTVNRKRKSSIYIAALMSAAFFVCAGNVFALDSSKQATSTSKKVQSLWLSKKESVELKKNIGINYLPLRFKYLELNGSRAWLLKEYGKEQLIDFKVTVKENKIVNIEVLEYRESYGGEIRQSRFRQQFSGASLRGSNLSQSVDGISGATISVNASKSVAKLALFLDAKIDG